MAAKYLFNQSVIPMLLLEAPACLPAFIVSPRLMFQTGHMPLKGHLGRVWSCP